MAFKLETKAQYGNPIPTVRGTESVVVRHIVVNDREQIELKLAWENPTKGTEGDVWVKHNGRNRLLALNLDTEASIDTLIAALTAAKADFTETPKVEDANTAPVTKATPITVKPIVVGRPKASPRKRAAKAA